MKGVYGAPIPDDQVAPIVDYLATEYGKPWYRRIHNERRGRIAFIDRLLRGDADRAVESGSRTPPSTSRST